MNKFMKYYFLLRTKSKRQAGFQKPRFLRLIIIINISNIKYFTTKHDLYLTMSTKQHHLAFFQASFDLFLKIIRLFGTKQIDVRC